jgi:sulfur relay (sulfurtransferase) DsrC/TusE family protein
MAVLTTHLQIASMQFVRKWYRLFGTVPNVEDVIPKAKVPDEENDSSDGTNTSRCLLKPYVKLA